MADEAAAGGLDRRRVNIQLAIVIGRGDNVAGRVVGVGDDAQSDDGLVDLLAAGEQVGQPRGLPDHERQHSGCHRIECAEMPDAAFAGEAPDMPHDIVRGHPFWLVDDKHAVHRG